MRYEFRGQAESSKKWIYSNKLSQAGFSHSMMVDGDATVWTPVVSDTVGRMYYLGNVSRNIKIYQGDIVRYTFTSGKECYNRVFVVEEDTQHAYLSEIYRDYDIDPETFEITRCRSLKHAEDRILMNETEAKSTRGVWKVLGNRWDNPELLNP